MLRQACTAALCALVLLGAPAWAGSAAHGHAPPQVLYGLELGRSRLEDAQAQWDAATAQVIGKGSAVAGAGVDHNGQLIVDPHIYVVDVAGAAFEGIDGRLVHFEFYDGVLYGFHLSLIPVMGGRQVEPPMSKEQVEALRQRLVQEYGPPTQSGSQFPGARKPDLYIWKFGPNQLQLSNGLFGAGLSYANIAIGRQAEASTRKIRMHPRDYQ